MDDRLKAALAAVEKLRAERRSAVVSGLEDLRNAAVWLSENPHHVECEPRLEALSHAAHRAHGTWGSYGFTSASEAGRLLEEALESASATTPIDWARLIGTLGRALEEATRGTAPAGGGPTPRD